VRKYKNKIECKKSDTNTNKIKVQAWIDLSKEYNAISGDTYRNAKVLRSKYENLKKRTNLLMKKHPNLELEVVPKNILT
jgi:hypothetical protein